MKNQTEIICPSCKLPILLTMFFCPNCGKQLIYKPPATTLSRQVVVYFVSLFIPPFGFWYGYKYFREGNSKARKIALAAVILTIISIIFTIWLSVGFINSVNQSLNEINSLNLKNI